MKITAIETIIIGDAGTPAARQWPVHLVHTDDGISGIGRGGNRDVIDNSLAALLVGQDPRRTALLWERMYEAIWHPNGPGRGGMTSLGALDIAFWDIAGKACGQPVWRLLGGYADEVEAYADGAGYADAPDQSPAGIAARVEECVAAGYRAVKIHMYEATEPAEVIERVRQTRERVGPDIKLMVDIHRAWDGATAAATARGLEPYDLYWIEEPVRGDDEFHAMRMVNEATSAMVSGGEGEGTLYGIRDLILHGGLQMVQTDILAGGGYTGLLRLAALAQAYHLPISPHGAQYPDINCHLVAAVPNGLIVPACPADDDHQIWSRLYEPGFAVEGGRIRMSEEPGLGLALDSGFADRHRAG